MYFLVSDIHGEYDSFKEIMKNWNPENEIFVFLGDAINRGKKTLDVIHLLMELKANYPDRVILLRGNHDNEWVKWLKTGKLADVYYWNYFDETINSFINPLLAQGVTKPINHQQELDLILENYQAEIEFMNTWKFYCETPNLIFVHAGIQLTLDNWKETSVDDLLWIREEFFLSPITPPKKIFFGHTPTQNLHRNKKKHDIWISSDELRVGIDGGLVFGGQLNAIKVNNEGEILEQYVIKK